MKILITGASGFIGKNLSEYLSKKHEILAPTHEDLELVDDSAVKKYFEKHAFDLVIHCAARPGHRNAKDPSNQLYINTRMFFNIVSNLGNSRRMIFISSGAVYDQRYCMPKMKEEYVDVRVPIDEGGFSKYIAAKYIEKTRNIIELRPFGVFGKYEDYTIRFISNAICKAIFELPITIKINRKFDYIYIDDLSAVVDYFLTHSTKYQCYNVTPGNSIELKTLAQKVLVTAKKDLPILIAQEGFGTEYSGDNTRLRNEIPDLKFTPIDTAISKLYQWYKDNIGLIKKENLLIDK